MTDIHRHCKVMLLQVFFWNCKWRVASEPDHGFFQQIKVSFLKAQRESFSQHYTTLQRIVLVSFCLQVRIKHGYKLSSETNDWEKAGNRRGSRSVMMAKNCKWHHQHSNTNQQKRVKGWIKISPDDIFCYNLKQWLHSKDVFENRAHE